MNQAFDLFSGLYIFEIANNHQGSVDHGAAIIAEMARLARRHHIRAAVKFQYRELSTFVHKSIGAESNVKHIKRFRDTELRRDDYQQLLELCRREGLITVVTPFDEASVENCLEDGVDILKIASCSAGDWPLLEAVADAQRPVIASTGGCQLADIDALVSFFSHRKVPLGILHCVGVYPMPPEIASLNFISKLSRRYPGVAVGWSGHELPSNTDVVKVAVAKGAQILERHVGIATDKWPLNSYSLSPVEADEWIKAAKEAACICGGTDKRITQEEFDSLRSLMRGVYATKDIDVGEEITADAVEYCMPCLGNQLTSGEFGRYRVRYLATRRYRAGDPILERGEFDDVSRIRSVVNDVKGMLYEAGIHLGADVTIELSHHYGIKQFRATGAVIVNVINRNYCKKLIILLPGQRHPIHWHERKEETFDVLYGEMEVVRNGDTLVLRAGDRMLIEPSVKHSFRTRTGVIFEEISTTHFRDDSFYEDERIQAADPLTRKTFLDKW